MNILGIETSCDETSIAVISGRELKANLISSQDFHKDFGGVIPELSSRAHLQMILPLTKQALKTARLELKDIDVVAATAGPGLIGAVLVGFNFAKGLAYSLGKPFVPVNHIEGHIYSGFLMEDKPEFPYLCLVVSGGHTLLLIVESDTKIVKLGSTIDDAAGEAFDKTAKMLGLEYPGGPLIQKYAEKGNENAIDFPIARTKREYDFSFSGLKTSVLRYIQKEYGMNGSVPETDIPDITASFQKAASGALEKNVLKSVQNYKVKSISIVGGVAANKKIRESITNIALHYKLKFVVPDLQFCGDNAAMIAYRGLKLFENNISFPPNFNAFARLPANWFNN